MTRSLLYELPLVKNDIEVSHKSPSYDLYHKTREIIFQKSSSIEAPNQVEEEQENDAVENNKEENNETVGFLWRIIREMRRRSAQKDDKRIQRRNQIQTLHQLLEKYQQELSVERQDSIQDIEMSIQKETKRREKMKYKVGKLVRNGTSRDHIDAYRCVQHLKLRRIHLEHSKNLLRQQVLETRKLEIEWLLRLSSQYLAQNDEDKIEDLPSSYIMGLFQLEPEDPFFMSPIQLLQARPETKKLDFQLKHAVVSLQTAKDHLKEKKRVGKTSFVLKSSKSFSSTSSFRENVSLPSTRRTSQLGTTTTRSIASSSASAGPNGSFRLLRSSSAVFFLHRGPNQSESTRRHELINTLTMMYQLKSTVPTRLDNSQYQSYIHHLNACRRLLSDTRTRSGHLLQKFYEKIEQEVTTSVEVKYSIDNNNSTSSNDTMNLFFSPFLLELVKKTKKKNHHHHPIEAKVIDQTRLLPSDCIIAFERFLYRLVISEYQLEEFCNTKSNNVNNVNRTFSIGKEFQFVLEESVHHLVFTKLSKFCMSYFTDDRLGCIFTLLHWQHGLDEFKMRPLERVGIEDKLLLDRIACKGPNFLLMTQQIFSQIQYEITPRGVMERIMRMMSQLHVEFLDLWEEKEKGKSFVNADLLIPLLVLVLIQCRKIEPTSCDILPLRVALVDHFQSTCYYSVTGEEAYYLTCLRAAIEFIMKSYCSPFSSDETECSECLEKMHRIQLTRKTSIDKTDIDKKQHILLPQSNTEVKQAIQALSEWISKQNIRREENNISVQDINTWMMS